MGQRSRKRRRTEGGAPAEPRQPRVRGEARNEQIRQTLEPLGEGERPKAVTVAAVVALLLALANLVLLVAGVEVNGEKPAAGGVVLFAALMGVAAYGMWRARYWAVLGFQAILGITLVIAGAQMMVASSVAAVALCVAILALGGWLFWKLVRALARLQMPERRPRSGDV
jgi:hypothetical protein